MSTESRYASAGVDTVAAEGAVAGLVEVLKTIGTPSRSVVSSGHYASVIDLDGEVGIAISTDGVGTKVIVAGQLGDYSTIGIDCIAMNVNDVICVGAKPLALVDYIAVEVADSEMLKAIGEGLKRGAEQAAIEIPGGELAQLPEIVKGAAPKQGFDLVGTSIGSVRLDRLVLGDGIEAGDAILGMPSSGVHSNGLTLARHALTDLGGLRFDAHVEEFGRTVGEELLEPTAIYVRAISALLASEIEVKGLAHITSGGLNNLARLNDRVDYAISDPLPTLAVFEVIQSLGQVSDEEMANVFNMGTGFCCVVPAAEAALAVELLNERHPGTRQIGSVVDGTGVVHGVD